MNLDEDEILGEIPSYYQGQKWDAPMTDDSIERDLSGFDCAICQEPITADDNAVMTNLPEHLECILRAVMGDVQHLEGRCTCGTRKEVTYESDEYETYREGAKATLQWLIDHRQGRFHDE